MYLFDFKEDPYDSSFQTSPGPIPFSEKETQAISHSLTEFKPDLFIDIHSGEESILIPYAAINKAR